MATLQVRVDDELKKSADALFPRLGMDTSTAVRVFLSAAVEFGGIPFEVRKRSVPTALAQALADVQTGNLHGPYDNAAQAVAAMLDE